MSLEKKVGANVISDADASSIKPGVKEVPKDGKYESTMETEAGKVVAPPANTDQV